MSRGRKIEDKLKELEGKFGEDFKMVLESIFDEFWSDFGAKLETKLAENRIPKIKENKIENNTET
jgi:hypothetical protein